MSSTTLSEDSDKLVKCAEGRDQLRPRERIMASAIELFRRHGIKGIGVDAIAEAADSNKMTLYRHFGSKDDLICACLKQVSASSENIWTHLQASYPDDPDKQLEGWVEAVANGVFKDPRGCDLANAAVELKEAGHPAHQIISDAKEAHRQRLVDLCQKAGIGQFERLAEALILLAEGARVCGQTTNANGPQLQLKQTCDAMIAAFSTRSGT